MKKELKRFHSLSKYNYDSLSTQKILMEEFINPREMRRYAQRMSEMVSLIESETSLSEDNNDSLIKLINNQEFEVNNITNFIESLKSSKRSAYLTHYTEEDFKLMTTYKIKGYNAGFAVKLDGDIVSVHNNSGIGGVGKHLIQAAVKVGGNKLDHFDGYLTGFYSSLGFKLVGSDGWNDDYAPTGWQYEPVNIFDPSMSIYAKQLEQIKIKGGEIPEHLKNKIQSYKEGKPDIVYRAI